jgi:hypothetical protein
MHSCPSMQERLTLALAHTDKPLLSRLPARCMSRTERSTRPVTFRLSVAYYDRRNSKRLQSTLRNFLSRASTPRATSLPWCVRPTGMSRGSCQLLTLSYSWQGCMSHVGIALEQRDSCTTVPYPSATLATQLDSQGYETLFSRPSSGCLVTTGVASTGCLWAVLWQVRFFIPIVDFESLCFFLRHLAFWHHVRSKMGTSERGGDGKVTLVFILPWRVYRCVLYNEIRRLG